MGISDRATRVVYAIDSSGSMMNNHAMQAAKGRSSPACNRSANRSSSR